MAEASDSGQPIPAHLAAQVPSAQKKALQHAYRRQILRTLRGDAKALSAYELAESGLVPCSVSGAAYHLWVLEGSGLVATAGAANDDTARQHFAAAVEDGNVVTEVLRDTAGPDRRFLGGTPS